MDGNSAVPQPNAAQQAVATAAAMPPPDPATVATQNPTPAAAAAPAPNDEAPPAPRPPGPLPGPAPTGATGKPPPPAQAVPTPAPAAGTPQSQPTPTVVKPPIDPRPYILLQQKAPEDAALIAKVAQDNGVSPEAVAAHWMLESGMSHTSGDGAAGEKGPFQITPDAAKTVDPTGKLDPTKLTDAAELAARIVRQGDNSFGRDSVSSFGSYQTGIDGMQRLADGKAGTLADHPNLARYLNDGFAGTDIGMNHLTGSGSMTPAGAVQAGATGGPPALLKYIANTAPSGMAMSDAWQHLDGMLTRMYITRGDIQGAQHASDWVLQQSHAGTNMYLMQAHQALSAGDPAGAAQALAKAHAFFPDGTTGRFGVDPKTGQVWATRLDESDPTRMLGQPFVVTPEGIAQQLNQTTDPQKFTETVRAEQLNAANIRKTDQMGNYYSGRLASNETIAAAHDATQRADIQARTDATTENARTRAAATTESARTRADATVQAAAVRSNKIGDEAGKDAAKLYGQDSTSTDPNTGMATRSLMADIHVDAAKMGANPVTAEAAARGFANKSLKLVPSADGQSYAMVDAKTGRPTALISKSLGDRIVGARSQTAAPASTQPGQPAGTPGPGASVVGTAAASPYARGAGISSDLTGTTQPQQAIPTTPGQ